jgi:hypothetical protein
MLGTTRRARLSLAVAVSVLGGSAVLGGASAAQAASTSAVPYHDPNAVGVVGFCDKAGHQVTSGSITTTPFAWRAVSSVAATAPYNTAGRTATLFAYQPRRGVAPGDWSGAQLTASARYTDASHPMAAATSRDLSLQSFMGQFAPQWDGLLQIRIFLGAPNQEIDSVTYPATTIKVTGSTWRVVGSTAPVSCTSGTSTSIESLLLAGGSSSSPTTSPAAETSTAPAVASAQPTSVAPAPTVSAAASSSSVALASATGSSGGHRAVIIALVVVLLIGFVAGAFVLGRRSISRSAG